MNLTINGENRSLAPVESLHALVEQLGMKSDRVAIELNREIVPRDQWAQTAIRDGDRLEIGSLTLQTVHTPGHTPEHVSFLAASACSPERSVSLGNRPLIW